MTLIDVHDIFRETALIRNDKEKNKLLPG